MSESGSTENGNLTFHRAIELELQCQIQFSVIPETFKSAIQDQRGFLFLLEIILRIHQGRSTMMIITNFLIVVESTEYK